jgi:arylsulfatase B
MKITQCPKVIPLLIAVVGLLFMMSVQATNKAPNVIMIVVDDVGFSDVAFNGNPVIKTPNLDNMARQGLNLTNFHTSTVCAPGRALLLTGRDHNRTGVWSTTMNYYRIRSDETIISQPFKDAGYATGMFGKWHNGDNYPYRPEDRGFTEVVRHGGGGVSQSPDYWGNDYFDDTYFHNSKPEKYKGYSADVFFDETIRFASENKKKNKPFFAYLATNTAHWPAIVPQKYLDAYRNHPRLQIGGKGGAIESQIFYAMIANIDENMGRLDKKLKELGLFENTIVIFTSDNGSRDPNAVTDFIPHFKGGKGAMVAEGSTRVPLLLRWPEGHLQKAGSVDNTLIKAQDLMPTLLNAAHIKSPEGVEFDGVDIMPVLKGDKTFIPAMQFEEQTAGIRPLGKFHKFIVRTQKWRLFSDKLIDIENDPHQKKNLAKQFPEVVEHLRKSYGKWHDQLEPSFDNLTYVVVGNAAENPSVLTSHDWAPPATEYQAELKKAKDGIKTKMGVPWLQSSIAKGQKINGRWFVEVDSAGDYNIELRRWPREENKPMTYGGDVAGLNADYMVRVTKEGKLAKRKQGKAIPMDSVRLKITDVNDKALFDQTKSVNINDHFINFDLTLSKGKNSIESWMFNSQSKFENRGAYFMYITKKNLYPLPFKVQDFSGN